MSDDERNGMAAVPYGFAKASDEELGRLVGNCIVACIGLEVALKFHNQQPLT